MKYLLDTCVISDMVRGELHTLKKIKSIRPENLYYSSITLMEILFGLKKNPTKAKKIWPILDEFFEKTTLIEFDSKKAELAASIRFQLQAKGKPIGPYDLLIAATALTYGYCMVTANTDEFSRVPGLKLLNWRAKATG